MRASGFVLVGGQSSRMGRDKARLPWNSHLLVEDVAGKVAKVAHYVALVGEPQRYADLNIEVLPDMRPHFGPLSGIEAALQNTSDNLNVIVACDMPNLQSQWLSSLLARAEKSNSLCVLSRDSDGKIHPLCGVYQQRCLPFVQKALDEGRLRLIDLVQELDAEVLSIEDRIVNVNTPDDWRALTAPIHV